ncbi:MAG: exosortase/archaeosortase family protein [Paludibacteraceae bacterium]|nr:exosortase/archaeosortase family protein [Paludibacteraceae bacterium]
MNRLKQHIARLLPYADVIIFMVTLLAANYFWKFTVMGDEAGYGAVTWFGINLTPVFDRLAEHTAAAVYWVVSLFRDTIYQADAVTLRFTSGSGSRIVWSCTPLKQSFIWLCLMLATPAVYHHTVPVNGSTSSTTDGTSAAKERVHARWHKLWYIPFGWIVIYLFNILRISAIMLFIEFHPEWFNVLHTYIFKYLFYGMMFLLWVIYVEKIRHAKSSKK